ncbi:MAG: YqaJ viral recombinase family protein [Pseudomonadota bacterium]
MGELVTERAEPMKTVNVIQGTEDWLRARAGIPTASEFGNLVSPTGKVRTGEMVETYLCRKLAERWTGAPLPSTYSGGGLEQGSLRESEAVPWYALTSGREIVPVGFITTDDGRFGCSPDGLFEDGSGIEVKCPDLHTHVKYLLDGALPAQYIAQVQGSILVAGAPEWTFLSYCRALPPLVVAVQADETLIETLQVALEAFCARLDAGYERLVELNGGPPERALVEESDDDIIAW